MEAELGTLEQRNVSIIIVYGVNYCLWCQLLCMVSIIVYDNLSVLSQINPSFNKTSHNKVARVLLYVCFCNRPPLSSEHNTLASYPGDSGSNPGSFRNFLQII